MKFAALLLCILFTASAGDKILVKESGEFFLPLRKNQEWKIPPHTGQERVKVEFEHRIDFPRLAGWNPCWQLTVNNKLVTAMATREHTRLLNKPLESTHMDHGPHRVCIGEKWYSLYAPDYERAKKRFYPVNEEAHRVVLDVTDLLNDKKENTIKLRFGSELSGFYKQENIKRQPALAVRNFRIVQEDKPSEIPIQREEVKYVRMKTLSPVAYRLDSANGLTVSFGKLSVPIASHFSAPGGKWFEMGGKMSLETPFYTVDRKIVREKNRIDVFDTFTSKSDQLIGLKIQYETASRPFDTIYLAGDPSPVHEMNEGGRNPSVFFADFNADQGLGLIAQDDVFRVQNIQYCKNGTAGIKTETFALSPKEKRTVEWSIYPVMSPDYFDFVNEVRRDWDVNFPIDGGFHLSLNCFQFWDKEKARKFHKDTGLKYNSLGVFYWRHLGGRYSSWLSVVFGAAFLDETVRTRTAPNVIENVPAEPMREFVRTMLARSKEAVPDVKRFVYVHNQWSTEIDDLKKYAGSTLTRPNGTDILEPPYHFFIPTTENAFGRKFMNFLEELCTNYDLDGIYHDEFTFTRRVKTYNQWDHVSVELDKNNNVRQKIGFVPLLKLDFNMKIMDYVLNKKGKLFIANFSPETRTERKFKYPRFEETYISSWIYLSHLYTPIQLGDMLTYGTTPEDCAADIRNAMKNGALYYHYNNQAACPTITTQMYPFTPIEIHRGWLMGKERILTAISGEFGWKKENALSLPYVYNEKGGLVPGYPALFFQTKDGIRCRLSLAKDYCAALVRIPVAAELDNGITLSDISFENGIFSCRASGKGVVRITVGDKTPQTFHVDGTLVIRLNRPDKG